MISILQFVKSENAMNNDPLILLEPEPPQGGTTLPGTGDDLIHVTFLTPLEYWLRLCAGNGELLAHYDRLRGTNLSGRGTPIDRMIDEATGRLEAEAVGFFDWCREMFERLGWDEEAVDE